MRTARDWSDVVVAVAGGLSAALGVAVMVGWHTHNERLLQIHPTFVAMVYNTALCFVLCGAGLAALVFRRPRAALGVGLAAAAFGGANLCQIVFGVTLGVDQLLMEAWQKTANPHPGRMAPQTAVCFLLTGVALALMGGPALRGWRPLAVGLAGSVDIALGFTSIFGRIFDVDTAGWQGFLSMALHTAVGFAMLGAGMMAVAWRDGRGAETGAPRWLPVPVGIGALTAALCLWQAMISQEFTQVGRIERVIEAEGLRLPAARQAQLVAEVRSPLPRLVLAVGILMALLLTVTVYLAQTARLRLETMRRAVGKLTATSAGLLANAGRQAAGAQEQASAISQTVSSMTQIAETAAHAAQQVKEVGKNAHVAVAVSQDGRQAVENAIVAMGEVQGRMASIADNILTLTERALTIGEIIAAVNEIAEQTNLLALNAAIEAARAGEHGQGFSVVARNVKDLADQSKKATAQVRTILGEIRQATATTAHSAEQGTAAAAAAANVVARAGATIKVVADTLAQTAQSAAQIVASAEQQANGMAQINQAMKEIEHVTTRNKAAIREIEHAAQALNALSNGLARLTGAGPAGESIVRGQ